MKFNVNVFLDGKKIEKEDLHKITICNKTIDRIINDIYEEKEKEAS